MLPNCLLLFLYSHLTGVATKRLCSLRMSWTVELIWVEVNSAIRTSVCVASWSDAPCSTWVLTLTQHMREGEAPTLITTLSVLEAL